MYRIKATDAFLKWFYTLKDKRIKARVLARLTLIEKGLFGDVKVIDPNINELRIHYGPGYRIYYTKQKETLILLLIAGDKSTQKRDILKARTLYQQLNDLEEYDESFRV